MSHLAILRPRGAREGRAGKVKNSAQSCAVSGLSSRELHTPTCTNCARLTFLTRAIRSFATLPELHFYSLQ